MLKNIMVTLSAFALIGCAGTGFDLDSPILQEFLTLCQDVPVTEYEDCISAELDSRDGAGAPTLGEILELLRSFQSPADAPADSPAE